MNEQEYTIWENDARRALSGRYSEAEIKEVLDFFRCIKGADERELVGDKEVEAFLVFSDAKGNFDLYNSMMARLFIYAPLILRQLN